jgi:hypothetical protein
MFAFRPITATGLVALALAATSCAKRDQLSGAEATGMVTLDGRPFTAGNVVFVGSAGSTIAEIQSDGTYRATNVPLGQVRVLLAPSAPASVPSGNARAGSSPKPQPAPNRYRSAVTSGLSLTVSSGDNPYDIAMTAR